MTARALLAAAAAVLVTVSLSQAPPASAKPKVRTYTVQPGDSIWSIAEAFYGSGKKYKLIYRHNKFIGSPPYILKPGQVLRLPEGELTPEAQVDWLKRKVKAKPPRSLDWLKANKRMNLWKLYKVSTGDDSAVHIVFEDESDLRLGDNALLVIYGGSKKSAKAKRREKTRVMLESGTARGGLAALDGKKEPMVVETPSGIVELAAKMAQVQADAAASAVSVYEGQATVRAAGGSVKVKKGYGTVVKKGKKPQKPRPLPPPPDWAIEGDGAAVAVVPAGGTATFAAAWKAVKGAHAYRVELAHDEAFTRVPVNVLVDKNTTRFTLENIPTGNYFARISARSKQGLEGRPSPALSIDVVGLQSSRRLAQGPEGGWEVAGLSRLDLGDTGAGLEWALDDGDFIAGTEPARVQGAGLHTIRVRRVGQTIVTPFELRVLAVEGRLEMADTKPLPADSTEVRELTLTARDERGMPAALPGVLLQAEPGGPLALEATGPGQWTAQLPAPEAPGPEQIAVRATWPGGVLGTSAVEVRQKFPDVPYIYRWRTGLNGLPWDDRAAATPLPSVAPIDRLGVQTSAVAVDGVSHAGLTLAGEVGLLDDDLALDAAWTLFRPALSHDELQEVELGDAVVGARYLAVRTPDLLIAPSLRARLAVSERGGERAWGVEPSALLRYRASRDVWLDTRQGLMASLGDDTVISYVGDYAGIFRLSDLLSLTAQVDTAALVSAPDGAGESFGAAAGVGALFHFDRLRLGLSVGFGLGAGGQERFGDVIGALTLDFGKGVQAPSEL